MMNSIKTIVGAALLTATVSSGAFAVASDPVVFVQTPDSGDDARISDLNAANAIGVLLEPGLTADNFVLASATTVTGLTWWGLDTFNIGATDNFTAAIYSDTAGAPGAVLWTGSLGGVTETVSPLVDQFGFEVSMYSADIAATPLGAGTYWLSVWNDFSATGSPTIDGDGDAWLWYGFFLFAPTDGLADGVYAARDTAGGLFTVSPDLDDQGAPLLGDLAFAVHGTAPVQTSEPASLAVLGFGLGLAAFGARRRRRA